MNQYKILFMNKHMKKNIKIRIGKIVIDFKMTILMGERWGTGIENRYSRMATYLHMVFLHCETKQTNQKNGTKVMSH